MFGIILTFIMSMVVGIVLGFINEITNGGLKWILLIGVVGLFVVLVANLGFSFGTLLFLLIVALVVRSLWRFIFGAISGVLSIFTPRL